MILMRANFTILLLCFATLSAMAQQTLDLYGYVVNSFTGEHIPFVQVSLLAGDSTVLRTTKSYNGRRNNRVQSLFEFEKVANGNYILRFEHPEYHTKHLNVTIKKENWRHATHQMEGVMLNQKSKVHELGEVVVVSTKVKMVVKGDTLQYNADAFRLARGSMLDELIAQLPGAELKSDGRIFVNGRFVESLTLNGKNFFKNDPKVLLENLPSFMVDKVKVYERDVSNEAFALQPNATQKVFTMDINLKKEYSIGWIANAEAGAGQDNRFLAKLFALRFSPQSRLSLFANTNNINDTQRPGRTGNWSPTDVPTGVLTTRTAGIDYLNEPNNQKYEIHSTTRVTSLSNLMDSRSDAITFLPQGDVYQRSRHQLTSDNVTVTSSHFLSRYIKKVNVTFEPELTYRRYSQAGSNQAATLTTNPAQWAHLSSVSSLVAGSVARASMLNHQHNQNQANEHYLHPSAKLRLHSRPWKSVADLVWLNARIDYESTRRKQYAHLFTEYPASPLQATDFRNQYTYIPSKNLRANVSLLYVYVLPIGISITPMYKHQYQHIHNDRNIYRLDSLPDWRVGTTHLLGELPSATNLLQSTIDQQNSYYSKQKTSVHTTGMEVTGEFNGAGGRFALEAKLPVLFENRQLHYHRQQRQSYLQRSYTFMAPTLSFYWRQYAPGAYRYYGVQASWEATAPSMLQQIEVRDNSQPLNVELGNPNLQPTHTLSTSASFVKHVQTRERVMQATVSYSRVNNAVAMGFVYDKTTGIRTTMPQNIDGNWHTGLNLTYGQALGKLNRWSFKNNIYLTYGHSVDLVGVEGLSIPQKSVVKNWNAHNTLEVKYRLPNHQLGAKVYGRWNKLTSNRPDFTEVNAGDFNCGITTLSDLMWGLQLHSDLTLYGRRGYVNEAMNTTDLVWNARLSKRFINGNLTVMVDAFDLLGQLSNMQRYVNSQGQTETYYNVVPRYVMLKAIYRLNIEPKDKKKKK